MVSDEKDETGVITALLCKSASSGPDILTRVGESGTRAIIREPRELEVRLRVGTRSGNGDDKSCSVIGSPDRSIGFGR